TEPGAIELVRRCRSDFFDQASSFLRHKLTIDEGAMMREFLQVLYDNKVSRISNAQASYRESVMEDGIDTGRLQHIEQVDPMLDRTRTKCIDVTFNKTIGMFVIAAEHDPIGMIFQQRE